MRQHVIPMTLTLLALAGCAGTGVIDYVRLEPGYRPQQFAYAAGGRDLRTEIQGNPFAMPQAEFDAAVTAAMQGAHFGPATNLTTTPGETARPDYRVRLLFNGPAAGSGALLCGGAPATIAPAAENGNVRLLAAFCNGADPLSYLTAHAGGIQGVQDPAFRDFMRQVTTNLFPPQNRQEQDRGCRPPGNC
ncbi:MAG: hypothetical protein AB7S71_12930 [Dongiaceae bacterium]